MTPALIILTLVAILVAFRLYVHRWWNKLSAEEKAANHRGH
jgi:hypothetical protein